MNHQQHNGMRVLRIKKIIEEAMDAKSFVLEPVGGGAIEYEPGQFLTLIFTNINGTEERRNYSISSLPGEPLQITVKRIANGAYSRLLIDKFIEGEEIRTIGAAGFFTLPDNTEHYTYISFFAAGSGITPVYPLIRTILHNHPCIKVLLVYSNSTIEQAIFHKHLKELQQQFADRFAIEFLFSSETRFMHKRLGIHLLEKFLHTYISAPVSRQLFYLCGPFEYMRMVTIVLRNHGVPMLNIRKEEFNIVKSEPKEEPEDRDSHTVNIIMRGTDYRFISKYPQTILQSAKALNIPLPYSCESGQCGTCAATCISGKVWMWRNDVLLDEEIAKGRVLTCTGYAVGSDITLRIS